MTHPFDVTQFGARGVATADDTAAIQKAIDAAGEVRGEVLVPPGQYRCGGLRLHPYVTLRGTGSYSYKGHGGSQLLLSDPQARCLLDISGCFGARVHGLTLSGENLDGQTCGILFDQEDFSKQEDQPEIEHCMITRFSGDGIRLNRTWVFSVRHCHILHNGGDGLFSAGWDGFLLDNFFSANRGWGIRMHWEAAMTITANRIEWNHKGNYFSEGGHNVSFTGNYIDSGGGPGVLIAPLRDTRPRHFTLTGNLFNRNGCRAEADSLDSVHLTMDAAEGVTVTGNSFGAGQNDRGTGHWRPSYGIVYGRLASCIITANAMHRSALKQLLLDQGGCEEDVIIRDNPGSLSRQRYE